MAYTTEEKMNNSVEYAKNALDDTAVALWNARCALDEAAKGPGKMSNTYAKALQEMLYGIQKMVEHIREEMVDDELRDFVSDEYPIKEEEE